MKCLTIWLTTLVCVLAGVETTARAVNLIQDFYLPMPEAQILLAEKTISSGITDTNMFMTTSILVTGNGTLIYYDQGEDGYETNLASPVQSTTKIWGDGNDAHGIPPGFAHNPTNLTAGMVITITNTVPVPSGTNVFLGNGGDHIAATKALVITRAGWPSPTGPVAAGAVSVLSTLDYGTNFVSAVGTNMPDSTFDYVGLFVMASQSNTTVTIVRDPTNAAATTITTNLNQGQSYLVNGGVKKGATITTSKPAQANLICGDMANQYGIYWFTLYPQSEWSSSYFAPVPSAFSGATLYTTVNYFYNTASNPITILYTNLTGSGSFVIPAKGGAEYPMPTNSGASFTSSGGQNYTVLTVVATNPTNNPGGSLDSTFNWGYTPLPLASLTTKAVVGWAPGSQDYSVNCSPVWVTPVSNTTIYVVFPGTNNAPLTDPAGGKYSTNYSLVALQSKTIYNPKTNDQSGIIVYTLDGALLSVAWGEDPATAPAGNPGLDCGTSVLAFPVPKISKSSVIVTDVPPAGLSVGDTVLYTVQVDNKGLLPLGNTVIIDTPIGTLSYISNSTSLNGVPIPDSTNGFPLSSPGYTITFIPGLGTSVFQYEDLVIGAGMVSNTVAISGTSITATNTIPPGGGAPTLSKVLYLSATNTPGAQVLNRVNPAATAGHGSTRTSVNLVSSGANTTTFTQTPLFAAPFIIASNQYVTVTNFITVTNGSIPAVPAITATLRVNGTNLITLSNPVYTENPGVNTNLVWSGILSTNVTIPANQAISYIITNNQAGTAFHINYDTTNQPSRINLPALNVPGNVILITNLAVYSAPYPSGTQASSPSAGSTLYIRVTATDPFGSYDISSVNIAVTGLTTNFNATLTNPVATNASSATFEYTWQTASSVGSNNIVAIAYEGSEGIYSYAQTNITLNSAADISITKSANSSVSAGQNLTYTITVSNAGPSVATNVIASDTLPPGAVVFNAGGGVSNNGVVTWPAIATLAGGGSSNYTLIVTAPANGVLTNFASVTNNTPDPVLTNNVTPPVVTTVNPLADAMVTNSAPLTVVAGTQYTNVITVTNMGPSVASNVVVVDLGPGGVLLSNVVGTLAVGGTTNFNVISTAPGSGPVTNTAVVSATTGDPNLFNNTNTAVSAVTPYATVTASKSGPGGVLAGNSYIYTIVVTNSGPSTASGVVVTDALPAGVSYVGATGGGTTNVTAGVVIWNLGTLTNGQTINLMVTNLAPLNAPAGGVLTNVARVGTPTGTNSLSPQVLTVVTNVADAMVTNSAPLTVVAGTTYTNVISVTNMGPSVASNVVVVDFGPGGVLLSNLVGTLAAGGTTNFNVISMAPASGPVTNTAVVSSTTGDPNLLNNTNQSVSAVTPSADVVVLNAGPGTVLAGTVYTNVITVTNMGPSVASNVVVTDTEPDGTVLNITVGTLPAGGTTNYYVVEVAPGSGPVTNVAVAGATTYDPNLLNNTNATVSAVTPVFDLAIGKSGSATIGATSNLTYNITVTNLGPSAASGVVVTDTVPVGASFVSASGNGANASGIVTWAIGTMTSGQVSNLTVTIKAPANGSITNIAGVGPLPNDPNVTNNVTPPVTTVVTAVADIVVSNSAPGTINAGALYTNIITVTNLGPSTASNVVVVDIGPGGVLLSNIVPVLASGTGTNWLVIQTGASSGPVTNVAVAGATTYDPNLLNNTNATVSAVTPVFDLAIGKSGSATIGATSNLTYNIVVTNLGPSVATGVVVTDTVPAGASFVSASGNGANASGIVTWAIGTMTSGQVSNLTVTIKAPANGSITNIAGVGPLPNDPNVTNNVTPPVITLVTAVADIVVSNSAPGTIYAGALYTNIVAVTNLGPSAASNVVVVDIGSGGVLLSNIVPVLASGSGTNWFVIQTGAASGPVTNVASAGSGTYDPNLSNNTNASVSSVTLVADVMVLNVAPGTVVAGTFYTNVITVTNMGPSVASNVVVADTLPNGSVSNFTAGTLPVGGTTNYYVVETAPGSGSVTNTAVAGATTFDPNLLNNTNRSVSVVTTVLTGADVQVLLFGPTNVTVGDGFFYTTVVTNAGPLTAVNTLVTNFLPTNLVFVSASGGGIYTNGVVTWPVFASLTNGQSTNLTVTVTAAAGVSTNSTTSNPFNFIQTNTSSITGIVTNRAAAFAATFDPNLTNNSASSAYTNAQVQTIIVPDAFSIFIATNTYPTNAIATNTVIPISPDLFIVGTSAFNPQTQLYEEFVSVTNVGHTVVHALRLYVGGLRSGVKLYNATGTNNGVPYVEYDPPYNSPLYPSNWVTFVLEFFVADRHPFTNSLSAVVVVAPTTSPITGTPVNIIQYGFNDLRNASNPRFLVQFTSIPGRTYTIEYSDDNMATWNFAVPSIVASATSTFWYDDGPPGTLSKPIYGSPHREYRVLLDP